MRRAFRLLAATIGLFGLQSLALAAIDETTREAVVQIRTAEKSGSGFFISKNGYLLTNDHVVSGASTVKICRQPDIKRNIICDRLATVITQDADIDIALLKINDVSATESFSYLPLATSVSLGLDDDVRLLGFPDSGGDSLTVTSGKVSGWLDNGSRIKVDASISSGSSGGVMIDANEQAIGVNVAVITGNFASSGVVIPIDLVKTWLFGSGYGNLASLGQTAEDLEHSKTALEELLQEYQRLAREQKGDYEDVIDKYQKQREEQEEQMEGVRESVEDKKRDYRSQIDSYLIDVQEQYSEATYDSEVVRLEKVWEDYLERTEGSLADVTKTYEANLNIIDRNEAAALEKAGIIDYTPRIAEAHAALENVKRELSKLRIASARKKANAKAQEDTDSPEVSPSDSEMQEDLSLPFETATVAYNNFGSPKSTTLDENWSVKSIAFNKNNRDFAFVFYKSLLPEVLRNTFLFEATITNADSNEEIRPLIVRKRLMMLMIEPGTKIIIELRALNRDGEILDTLRFETST